MVVFLLRIKAELDNVESITFPENSQWCLDLKQSDGDEVKEGVYISSEEECEMSGSRGVAHFVMKFPGGAKEVSVNVQQVKGKTRQYLSDDSGQMVPVVAFECRGCEPVGWHPQTSCRVKTTGGKVFEDVDLEEKEWCEFDDENDLSVEIMELGYDFVKSK